MVTIVFALAVANLGLGFALAVAIERMPFFRLSRSSTSSAESQSELCVSDDHGGTATVGSTDDWGKKLKAAKVDPDSTMERLLWIAKLSAEERRERLVALDSDFFSPDAPQSIAQDLKEELNDFQAQLDHWVMDVDVEKDNGEELAEAFQELLLDQSFQMQSCIDGLANDSRDAVASQLVVGINAVNVLRDRIDQLLCQLLIAEQRLNTVPAAFQTLGERETFTHLGLASLFEQWWADDPDHVRLVSLVMLDLDRFDLFTQRIGTARGDIALLRFGDMLHDLLRKDRGFDRLGRFSGQRFVMFMGDTSAKNAAKGAERIRQTIEATSFKLGDETSEVTASLAVVQVGQSEGPPEFLSRLEATLSECKKAGRNCGFVSTDDGPERIELPQYQVNVRVIELDEEDGTE